MNREPTEPTTLRVFAPALLSSVLLWLSYFPASLGPLAWGALIPWLSLVRSPARPWKLYLAAWLSGFVFFALALHWIAAAVHPMMKFIAWPALTLYCSLYFPLALCWMRRIDARAIVPLVGQVPMVWVGLEFVRMHFPTGFPFLEETGWRHHIGFGWYFLGYTQHAWLEMIQIADLVGVYGVSIVVAAVNALGFVWLSRKESVRSWLGWPASVPRETDFQLRWSAVGVLGLVGVTWGYGWWQLNAQPKPREGPALALMQGNLHQDARNARGQEMFEHYTRLCDEAAALRPMPDMIVWPETSFPVDWYSIAPGVDPQQAPEEFLWRPNPRVWKWRTHLLVGLNGREWHGPNRVYRYNSAQMVYPNTTGGPRYDKHHLVPFTEYIPLADIFPFMKVFSPYPAEYQCKPGESFTRFDLPTATGHWKFGVIICYEDSDPSLARQYVRGDPVDFLVNISNDGWFDGSSEHEEHLAICRFRAVECRRAVVRAVNMGISALIDADGRILALPAESWSQSKKIEKVMHVHVPIDARRSIYAQIGDLLPLVCWGGGVMALLLGPRSRRTVGGDLVR